MRALRGLEVARKVDGVVEAEVFVPVGGQVLPLTDSAKRAGYVLAHAPTRAEVLARADRALAAIDLETSPTP